MAWFAKSGQIPSGLKNQFEKKVKKPYKISNHNIVKGVGARSGKYNMTLKLDYSMVTRLFGNG